MPVKKILKSRQRKQREVSPPWWRGSASKAVATLIVAPVTATVVAALILQVFSTPDDGSAGTENGGAGTSIRPETGQLTSTPARSPREPLKIALVKDEHDDDFDSWVTPEAITSVPEEVRSLGYFAGSPSALQWIKGQGGVNDYESLHTVILKGNRPDGLRIIDMHPIAKCQKPLNGTLFLSPSAGSDDTVRIGFNLDDLSPVARAMDRFGGNFKGKYFANNTYHLDQGEEVVFKITARTTKYYCEYSLRLDLIVDGRPAEQIIDNNGQPFRASASIPAKNYKTVYVGGLANGEEEGWTRVDPNDPCLDLELCRP